MNMFKSKKSQAWGRRNGHKAPCLSQKLFIINNFKETEIQFSLRGNIGYTKTHSFNRIYWYQYLCRYTDWPCSFIMCSSAFTFLKWLYNLIWHISFLHWPALLTHQQESEFVFHILWKLCPTKIHILKVNPPRVEAASDEIMKVKSWWSFVLWQKRARGTHLS